MGGWLGESVAGSEKLRIRLKLSRVSHKTFPTWFLLNFSDYKHARKVGSLASSGVKKLFCTIFGSQDVSKLKWGIRSQNVYILDNLSVLKSNTAAMYA